MKKRMLKKNSVQNSIPFDVSTQKGKITLSMFLTKIVMVLRYNLSVLTSRFSLTDMIPP